MALQTNPLAKTRRSLARRAVVAVAAIAVTMVGAVSGGSSAVAADGYHAPILSESAWASGVFVPGYDTADNQDWADWRERPLDVVVTWPVPRDNWDSFIEPGPAYSSYSGKPYTMVYGVPPIPEDGPDGATMSGCANGDYNDKWTTFGHTMTDADLGSSIIRLGWEMNGEWYDWSKYGVTALEFKNCWIQIVDTVREVAPDLKFDFSVNRGWSKSFDTEEAYPGDEYVDIIGIDSYDSWLDWDDQLNSDYALNWWLDFAKAHGKKLSLPEWGLFTDENGNAGHGDNPEYIQHMHDFFTANADDIAYEAYFNNDGSDGANSLYPVVQMPESAAKYKELWHVDQTGAPVTKIEDTAVGTTTGKVQFSANWGQCDASTCGKSSDSSYKWTATTGSTATVRFTGQQIKWIGMKEPQSVIATVSIDGGTPTDVDPYSATASSTTTLLYTSPVLAEGNHTAVITMTNRRNANASTTAGSSITFDRADVVSGGIVPELTTPIQDTVQGNTTGKVQFSANWGQCDASTCSKSSDSSYKWTATTGSTATVRFTGHQIKWIGMKEPQSVIATISIDGGTPTDVDPYSATASTSTTLLYTSPVLTEGNHTAVITMTNRRNANASTTAGSSITFDRADILSAG